MRAFENFVIYRSFEFHVMTFSFLDNLPAN